MENISKFGVPTVVAINNFPTDTERELYRLYDMCCSLGVPAAQTQVWARGGEGGLELAQKVVDTIAEGRGDFRLLYPDNWSLKEKIEIVAREIYGADGVNYTTAAELQLKNIESIGYGVLPVCIAKTQYSLSDEPEKLGCPRGFRITVREVRLSAGAGFVVPITGDILTMPGLPKMPAACSMDIDGDGKITGLF